MARRALRAAILAAAAALLAAGCATVPTVGQPQAVTGATGQVPQAVQLIPPVPQANWSPAKIVLGFLSASASFTGNHAAAQKFLTPSARRTFQLGRWAVTVVSGQPSNVPVSLGPPGKGQPGLYQVTLQAQQVATISDIGQYVYDPAAPVYKFGLAKVNGQWRITSLTPPALLLTQDSFTDTYLPRNLYFWASDHSSLVPEPVFAPQQDTYAAAAASLVNALLRANQGQGGQDRTTWLGAATRTSFPAGTTLIGDKVTFAGQTAIVNLGGAVTRATSDQLQLGTAQLIATLTSTSYSSPALAQHVELEVNGQVQPNTVPRAFYASVLPGSAGGPGSPLYYLARNGAVSELTGPAGKAVRNPPGHGQIPFTQIAVTQTPGTAQTPGTQLLAGTVASAGGCGVYYGPLTGTTALTLRALPAAAGRCTSVSWDGLGDIWAVTAAGIWILPAGGRQFVPVTLPQLPGGSTTPYRVLSIRVAPDGVRVAMLVQTGAGSPGGAQSQVVMAAVSHPGSDYQLGPTVAVGPSLDDAAALSWLDPDHLVVLAHSLLYSVPVSGGAPAVIEAAPPGATSVSATGPGRIAVAGSGQIWTSTGPQQALVPITEPGTSAGYQQ
jgi:hypothetical protein